jgi:acylphosphatase
MAVCKHVHYSGRVQGVGFRYTTQHLAESHPVSGYVHNLRDGNVEVVAEGEAEAVEAFLAALGRQMAGYIKQTAVEEVPCGGYQGFRVQY